MDFSLHWVEYYCHEQVWGVEDVSRYRYEHGLRDRECNIIGFWPYSVKWAEWHGLSGVFCGDIIQDKRSSFLHGYRRLTDDDMLVEQKRLTATLKSLIKVWPTHSLNLDTLEQLEDGATTIAHHNNKQIFVVKKGKTIKKYGQNADHHRLLY